MKWRDRFAPPQDVLPGDHKKRLAKPYIAKLIELELDADQAEARGDRDEARGIRKGAAILRRHLERLESMA